MFRSRDLKTLHEYGHVGTHFLGIFVLNNNAISKILYDFPADHEIQ